MATARNFTLSGINSGHHNLPTYMKCRRNRTMLNLCGIVETIFQCRESIRDIIIYPHMKCRWNRRMLNLKMVTARNFPMSGINSGHHYLPTYQILMISDNVEFLPPIFYAVFWQPFWKWQTSRKFWKCRIAPLMMTYHYVKFYVYHYPFRSYQH
jgi:hypothetical protein